MVDVDSNATELVVNMTTFLRYQQQQTERQQFTAKIRLSSFIDLIECSFQVNIELSAHGAQGCRLILTARQLRIGLEDGTRFVYVLQVHYPSDNPLRKGIRLDSYE